MTDAPPATADDIADAVARMAGVLAFGQDDAGAKARMTELARALGDEGATGVDVAAAASQIIRRATFFPSIAEVLDAVRFACARRTYRRSRARHLIADHERNWRPAGEPANPDDVAALLRDARAAFSSERAA